MRDVWFRPLLLALLALLVIAQAPQFYESWCRILRVANPQPAPPAQSAVVPPAPPTGRRSVQCLGTPARKACVGEAAWLNPLLGPIIQTQKLPSGLHVETYELRGGRTACWVTRGKGGVITAMECEGPLD